MAKKAVGVNEHGLGLEIRPQKDLGGVRGPDAKGLNDGTVRMELGRNSVKF